MKKTHIIAIIIIAVAIGVIFSSITDAATYANFTTVEQSPNREFQVVGQLNKEKPIEYEPQKNANLFAFYMVDNDGKENRVIFNGAKPQDFERSEQVVVTGKWKEDAFHADKILMKCPSKYNDGKMEGGYEEITAESASNS